MSTDEEKHRRYTDREEIGKRRWRKTGKISCGWTREWIKKK